VSFFCRAITIGGLLRSEICGAAPGLSNWRGGIVAIPVDGRFHARSLRGKHHRAPSPRACGGFAPPW